MFRRFAILACSAVLIAAPESVATEPAVQSRQLTIEMFNATYTIDRDGVVFVEERLRFRFDGSWNGVYRWIPVKYNLSDGGRHRIYLDVESVTDDAGNSLRHEVKRDGAIIKIKTWVPGAHNTTKTVVYRYKVENALRAFDDDDGMEWAHDEFYWNVNGDESDLEHVRVQATVHLPPEVSGLRATAYTGRRGSTGSDVEQITGASSVSFETTRRLSYREGLTIVVGWDPGVVARPGAVTRTRWLILDDLFVPLPIIAFFAMLSMWRKKGRDPELNRSIMPQYDPPEGMTPAEIGTLMDFSLDPRDLSATIIDLAVRGYLRIEEVPGKKPGRPEDHIIHIVKDPAGVTDLKDFEHETLVALYNLAEEEGGHYSVQVSDLKQQFYKYVPKIKRRVLDLLTSPPKLFTARPERVIGAWIGIGFFVAILCVGLGIIATKLGIGNPIARWVSVAAVPVIVMGFGVAMPARTLKGARLLNHVLGLREYIDRVDRDRLKYATLEHFEKLLPFAAAMGLEEKWTEAFETIIVEAPGWYVAHHPGHFHAHYFSNSLGRMTSATGSALVTAPRSASSGSGFSSGGGGFSGGGFGGGGSGGF